MINISLKQFYKALETNGYDLRQIGEYKVAAEDGREVFPINISVQGMDVHLGKGDFTNCFTAFCDTKAKSLHLDDCAFSQLYFDFAACDEVHFCNTKAASVMFDSAKIGECKFENFETKELYMDHSAMKTISIDNLSVHKLFVGTMKPSEVNFGNRDVSEFKILFDAGGSDSFGNFRPPNEIDGDKNVVPGKNITVFTINEFQDLMASKQNPATLGEYTVVPDDSGASLTITTSIENLNLGKGNFEKVEVIFANSKIKKLGFGQSTFSNLNITNIEMGTMDFESATIDKLKVDENTNIDTLFFAGAEISDCEVNDTHIAYLFVNKLKNKSLKFFNSNLGQVYCSTGDHGDLFFDGCEVKMFNGHEATFGTIDFGKSRFGRILMRETNAKEINAINLVADQFMVGYFDNQIDNVVVNEQTLGGSDGIRSFYVRKIDPIDHSRKVEIDSKRQPSMPTNFTMR